VGSVRSSQATAPRAGRVPTTAKIITTKPGGGEGQTEENEAHIRDDYKTIRCTIATLSFQRDLSRLELTSTAMRPDILDHISTYYYAAFYAMKIQLP